MQLYNNYVIKLKVLNYIPRMSPYNMYCMEFLTCEAWIIKMCWLCAALTFFFSSSPFVTLWQGRPIKRSPVARTIWQHAPAAGCGFHVREARKCNIAEAIIFSPSSVAIKHLLEILERMDDGGGWSKVWVTFWHNWLFLWPRLKWDRYVRNIATEELHLDSEMKTS